MSHLHLLVSLSHVDVWLDAFQSAGVYDLQSSELQSGCNVNAIPVSDTRGWDS